MLEFQRSLPEGFHSRLSSIVISMVKGNRTKKKDEIVEMYNTELIFSWVIYLLSANQIDLDVFNYELAPFPTSIFEDSGEPRFTKSKSVLKNKLKVQVSSRNIKPDPVVTYGGGMLYYAVHWPKWGLVSEFIDGVTSYFFKILKDADVYLAFDWYYENSIKSATRLQRIGTIKRSHRITTETPLPLKDILLSSNKTKENLIELIAVELIDCVNKLLHSENSLIITSKSEFPIQSHNGVKITRYDLKTTFDEADYIIPHQVVTAFEEGKQKIKVISADTDVFVLLCHFYKSMNRM